MAKVVRQNLLNTVYQKQLKLAALLLLIGGLSAYLPWKLYKWIGWPGAVGILLAGALLFVFLYRTMTITAAGAQGERETLLLLKKNLGSHFWILPDRVLTYGSHKSQVDYLILAPGRLILLECKNVSGVIEGKTTDHDLRQRKICQGKVYEEKTLYNPLFQLAGHRKTLQNICRSQGLQLPIETAVYFSNPNGKVRMQGDTSRIFTVQEREKLLSWLRGMDGAESPSGWRKDFVAKLNNK